MFALDVFGEYGFPEVLVALFMHLIPSFVLIALLITAWKWPRLGGVLFLVLTLIFVVFFKLYEDFIVFLIVGLPVFIIGILFTLNSFKKCLDSPNSQVSPSRKKKNGAKS